MKRLQSFYKNKNVLVTGGAGFIGSHIAQQLCAHGANVTILDDLSTGSLDNIKPFCNKINLIASDITILKSCMKATKKQDIVFHLAAFISVPDSVKRPAICEKINVHGTRNLLEACKKNKVQSFVFSSSAAIYGERAGSCREDDKPKPQSPYAKSKLAGEKLCEKYFQDYSINTACLRYFNVYGERQNPFGAYAGVAAKFKYNLKNKAPITIYGNGEQTRDFISVKEVALANLMIGSHAPLRGDVFNVASGTSITLLDLLDRLETEMSTKRVDLKFKPARAGDITFSQANCKKLKSFKNHLL